MPCTCPSLPPPLPSQCPMQVWHPDPQSIAATSEPLQARLRDPSSPSSALSVTCWSRQLLKLFEWARCQALTSSSGVSGLRCVDWDATLHCLLSSLGVAHHNR
eukprot:EG_transcript_58021